MTPDAATTWATSWIDAPAHIPARAGLSPIQPASRGSRGIMAVPKSTTRATDVTSSSSSDSMTPSTAAAAAAPQIEKPPAMSRVCERLSPSSRPTAIGAGDPEHDDRHHDPDDSPSQPEHVAERQLEPEQRDTEAQQSSGCHGEARLQARAEPAGVGERGAGDDGDAAAG